MTGRTSQTQSNSDATSVRTFSVRSVSCRAKKRTDIWHRTDITSANAWSSFHSFSTPFQKHALIRPGLVCERRAPLNGGHGRVPILQLGVPHHDHPVILSETSPTTSTNPNAPASNTTAAATSVPPPSSPTSPTTTPLPTKVRFPVSPFPLEPPAESVPDPYGDSERKWRVERARARISAGTTRCATITTTNSTTKRSSC